MADKDGKAGAGGTSAGADAGPDMEKLRRTASQMGGAGAAAAGDMGRQAADKMQAGQKAMADAGQAMSQRAQELFQEWVRASQTTLERRTQQMSQLAGARTVADIMRIQSEIAQAEYRDAMEFTRRIGEMTNAASSDLMQRMSGMGRGG